MKYFLFLIILLIISLTPSSIKSSNISFFASQYPTVILTVGDWKYVLEEPGGRIILIKGGK